MLISCFFNHVWADGHLWLNDNRSAWLTFYSGNASASFSLQRQRR
jgi:hypothetical protein